MYEKVLEWSKWEMGEHLIFHYIKDDGGQKNIFSDFLRLMLSEIETAHVAATRLCHLILDSLH